MPDEQPVTRTVFEGALRVDMSERYACGTLPPMQRPRLVGINHIALEVGDIDEALAFYGAIFEIELRGRMRRRGVRRHG